MRRVTKKPRREPGKEPRRFVRRPRPCPFCQGDGGWVDYKDERVLRRYISERGKILPRRATHLCAKHQRQVSKAIKRAQHIALIPFSAEIYH